MKKIKFGLLAAALGVNAALMIPRLLWIGRLFRQTAPLSLEEKRLFLFPAFYRDILAIRRLVPEQAVLWVISAGPPVHINYYLYPRTLRFGSNRLEDLPRLRAAHPKDWVLIHRSGDPQLDRLRIFPPIDRHP